MLQAEARYFKWLAAKFQNSFLAQNSQVSVGKVADVPQETT